jgi:hypothetical protein
VKQGPALLFAGLAAWLLLRPREAQALQIDAASNDISVVPPAAVTNLETNPIYNFVQIPPEVQAMNEPQANLSAFLFMIRATEHVYPRDVLNDAAYSIFYGGSKFSNFSDHPVLTGEKKGVPLPDNFCRAAGLKPGCGCLSDHQGDMDTDQSPTEPARLLTALARPGCGRSAR